MPKTVNFSRCGYCSVFDFTESDSTNSWVIQGLIKSIPIVEDYVLTPDEQHIFHLIAYNNYSQADCALVLGRPKSTINRIYNKALNKLKIQLPLIKSVLEAVHEE